MKKRAGFLLALLLAGGAGGVSAASLKMDDFAYGMPLQMDGDGAIYSLPMPAEVYRRTLRADLGDMRVFNGQGEVVPHMLQREPRQQSLAARQMEGKLYPLPTSESQPDNEELHIAIGKDGTLIDFYGGRLPLQGAGSGEYYLLDASEADAVVERLYLRWDALAEPLLTQVTVHGSDDLNHWQLLVDKSTIAELNHQGLQLEQHYLALPVRRMKYYRIHWQPGSKGIALRSVELWLRPVHTPLPGEMQTVLSRGEADRDGSYYFTLGGHFPVTGVRLQMPQRNTAVRATLYSRADKALPWQRRYQGLLYDLEREGQRLRSEPVSLPSLSHSLWRLEVPPSGGGLGRGLPQLELEWHPQRLLFVARGEMPYTLAFGRQLTEGDGATIDPLLLRIDADEAEAGFIKSARAGQWFELGGKARLQAAPPPLPWKKWLLWVVLLSGVLVLALMVRSLYRQMRRDESRL
jgi:hypothetical protein